MYCLVCEPAVELDKEASGENDYGFYQYYICPKCKSLHLCTSQSGDMIQENLDLLE